MELDREYPAASGVATRSSTLKCAKNGGLILDASKLEPFGGTTMINTPPPLLNDVTRKCCYNYNDPQSFTRIVDSDCLLFDSHFESGNLQTAYRISSRHAVSSQSQEYDLVMHDDIPCSSHCQWYYFGVSNICSNSTIVLNIINFRKPESLYNNGMRPLMMTVYNRPSNRHKHDKIGSVTCNSSWSRVGSNIRFYPTSTDRVTNYNITPSQESSSLFTLTFSHRFDGSHPSHIHYFSYCFPYTYTDLQRQLICLSRSQDRSACIRRSLLCVTEAGNHVELLTITEPSANPAVILARPIIVITARVHPGESNGSWIMHGVIDFLTSHRPEANLLCRLFVFKLIPMLNPDGVINGNYRTSLSGSDLNRKWSDPSMSAHPSIYFAKLLLSRLQGQYEPEKNDDDLMYQPDCHVNDRMRRVMLVVDFHGHSRRQGVFMFGCDPANVISDVNIDSSSSSRVASLTVSNAVKQLRPISAPMTNLTIIRSLKQQGPASHDAINEMVNKYPQTNLVNILPSIMSSFCPFFRSNYCSTQMQPDKASTMRMVMYNSLHIPCSYTMETSVAGDEKIGHFSIQNLISIGFDVCKSILEWSSIVAPNYHMILNESSRVPRNVIHVNLDGNCNANDDSDDDVVVPRRKVKSQRSTSAAAGKRSQTSKEKPSNEGKSRRRSAIVQSERMRDLLDAAGVIKVKKKRKDKAGSFKQYALPKLVKRKMKIIKV